MNYSIEKVTTLIGAHRYGDTPAEVGFLLTDSRSLCFPEETLFFALKSDRNDGHHYIDELYRRGVRNFVVGQLPQDYATRYPDANFLKVPQPLEALQRLTERHRDEFQIPIVGITGSNGKTIVKEWLYQVLSGVNSDPSSNAMAVIRSPRSYNSQIGVPLSVWLLNEQTQVGIFEAGISKPGEMASLRDIIQPTIGVITNIGAAHQENFRSMDEKCIEKLKLFHDAEVVFYPASDPVIARHIGSLKCKTIPYQAWEGELPFIDRASKENAGAVAAVAQYIFEANLHSPLSSLLSPLIAERLKQLEPVAMRLEVKEGRQGCTLINDSYNSDINSLDIALDFMNRRPDHEGRKRTLVLSDIYQSGMSPEVLYREVSLLCEKRGVEKFIGIGPEITAQADEIAIPQKYFFRSCEDFIQSEVFRNLHDEVILIKGARSFGFDRLTEQLEQKVHETILAVNLNALVDNLNYYRSFLHSDTKIVCMVKADAYGAGAVEVAKTLQDHRVDYLAVAVADEGVTLRKAGITQNIMIMNPEMTSFKTMFDYELEPEVYSFRLLDALIKAARKEGITGYPVHIKLDTGMHRLGFEAYPLSPSRRDGVIDDSNPSLRERLQVGEHRLGFGSQTPLPSGGVGGGPEIDRLIDILQHQQAVVPRSVFSHFVGSDSVDFDEFSALQFERFDKASRRLQAAFPHKILRHMDNSAGIEHFPERQLDMCRLGIGLYGVDSIDNRILNTVSTLKTTILQMRRVPKEETVGYSRKGVLTRDSVIAAIPIGYADGLNRHLGRGRCYCLVNGQKAPYVGNICMDVAMIDVTDIDCREGDTVEIFGSHLPVTVLSDCLDTIPYEVLTGISNRVKRVYVQE